VQPDKIRSNAEFQSQLASLKPDAIIVVGYGRLIPDWMIALPPLGNINLHTSLLPKYRGAGPIQWAIASGETVTGVTTMRIDAGLDTGDILLQREVAIAPDDTAVTLAPRLAAVGADLMVETLRGLRDGTVQPRPQDHARATLAPILKKEDGLIDFQRSAQDLHNRLRGFQPWPGAFTTFRGKQLQVISAKPLSSTTIKPGEIAIEAGDLLVGCANSTALQLLEIQPEGKKKMTSQDFLNGYRPQPGEKLADR
jgi:methionyl-tRNA formyltransferase